MIQQNQGEAARQQAETAAHQARDTTARAAQQAKGTAQAAAEQTQRKVSEYAQQAKGRGMEVLDQQKHSAAAQLHTLGEAAHRAAGRFREDRDDNIAGYVDAAAGEVDRLAAYLERRDMGSLMQDVQDLARRRPELFLGGMFVAGLALTRFLKASRRHDHHGQPGEHESSAAAVPPRASVGQIHSQSYPSAGTAGSPANTAPADPGSAGPH